MPDDAWLAPALTQMLGAQLGAADEIRVIPDTFVREASKNLPVPNTAGYGRDALAKLRKRLNADYVISGHFHVGESDADRQLFVDVELQDAAQRRVGCIAVQRGWFVGAQLSGR